MRKSMQFNNIRKPWLYLLEGRQKSPFAPVRNNLIRVTGMPGAYVDSKDIDVLYITQPIGFIVENDDHALQLKDELAEWLLTEVAVPLEFDDEPGRTYYAEIEGTIEDFSKFVDQRKGVITFLCADPFSYGPEKTLFFPADIVTIENKGTAEADPIFEMTATQKTTFASISNGDEEYNLIGTLVEEDGNEEIVDQRVSVFFEDGTSTDSWATTGADVDSHVNDVSGAMTSDGSGIRAQSYGTGNKMHGPAIVKELPSALEDFEIVANLDIISERLIENFRAEIYFHDENMNMLGKMGIKDNTRSYLRRYGLGRVGRYRGSDESDGYVIGGHNYKRDMLNTENTLMHLWVKREGNVYTFYIARWQGQHHRWIVKESYVDATGEYSGKLKFVTIFLGNYKDRNSPSRLRVNNLEVFELKQLTVDQTPYILYPGDVVEFDHKNDDILVNGEPRNDLKNFGGSFFKLKKGGNQLIVTPEESFNTKVTFRDKYR